MTLRKVGATMMNENVKEAYERMVEARNTLVCTTDEKTINKCMSQLFACMVLLQKEEPYAVLAFSLQKHIFSYLDGKENKDFILDYVSNLIEMIEDRNKPAYEEEIKQMYEDARTAFEEVTSTVQEGFNAAKERVKEEGPKRVAEAEKKAKKMVRKFVDGFDKWLNEDEQEENAEGEDGDE